MDKISISSTIIAEDFNAKIRKRNGAGNCIGQWSKGRNDSGSKPAEFCEMNNKVITNSCFQHPRKHIRTTSSLTRNKNRPSYRAPETSSDHRLIVGRT